MPPAIPRIGRGPPADRKKTPPGRTTSHKFRAQDFVRKRQNEALTDHYTIGKLLGEGQFGEVFVGTVKKSNGGKGDTRAIKRIQKELLTEEDHDEVFNEFLTLRQMDHPNICKMYEFFEDNDNFWFVQELCAGGELLEELERTETFTEAAAALIMKQVLSCVHYCHSQKHVAHRDLKLENILLEESGGNNQKGGSSRAITTTVDDPYNPMIVKVIDFGLATTFTEDRVLTAPVGSMHYIAPEVLEQEYGPKCDIWSCGVIAYILLCGYAPFEGANDRDMRELIMMGHVSFEDDIWQNTVSKEAIDFVSYLLTYEPEKRPDAGQALKHPWIQNAHKVHSEQFKANKSGTDAAVQALNNCRSFEAASKLKQATCAFMTSQLVLSADNTDSGGGGGSNCSSTDGSANNGGSLAATTTATAMLIGEIFRAMDLDSDGRLSQEELRLGFLDFLGESAGLTVEEVDDIFQRMDLSFTGYIDYSEFVVAAMGLHDQEQAHHQELLKQAFQRLLDKDGSGFISHEKLRKEMTPFYGEDVEETIIQKIIDQVDEDKDGQVSWEDFQAMMSKKANFLPTEKPTPLPRKTTKVQEVASRDDEPSKKEEQLINSPATTDNGGDAKEETHEEKEKDKQLLLASTTKTPPTPGRRLRSSAAGPKARLISAIFEKNLEKNREMGFDQFLDSQKQSPKLQTTQKRKLPRTRRVNFEELTKKATHKVDFDPNARREGRNKEIELLKAATPGRARERRATIVSMFQKEKEESRTRKESRLRELKESIKGQQHARGRQEMMRSSFVDSNTRKLEQQQREVRSEELKKLRASIADISEAKKRLFELWNHNETWSKNVTIAGSRPLMMKELKEFQKTFVHPGRLKDKFMWNRPIRPAGSNRQLGRGWTKRLSGRSLLKESSTERSGHEKRPLERTSSHSALRDDEVVEDRLTQMQPHSNPPERAKLIEPIRRLDSFDSEQENMEREKRYDEMLPEDSPSKEPESLDTESEILQLPVDDTGSAPPLRCRLASHEAPWEKDQRLLEMEQNGGLQGNKVIKKAGMVKSSSLQFERMSNSASFERKSITQPNAADATFEKMNKSSNLTACKKAERLRELRSKSDTDAPDQNFEKLNNSINQEVMIPQREARLEELKQLTKQKSGKAKFAREQFEEKIQANEKHAKLKSQSMVVGNAGAAQDTSDNTIPRRASKRNSISWTDQGSDKNNAETSTEHQPTDEEKTNAHAPPRKQETDRSDPESASQQAEKDEEMNDNSMKGLDFVGSSSAREGDSISSIDHGSRNNLSLSAIHEGSPETRTHRSRCYVEKPAPKSPHNRIITPRNQPRFGPPTTPTSAGQKKKLMSRRIMGRRASASAAIPTPQVPSLTEAQSKFQDMARDRASRAKAKENEANVADAEADPADAKA